MGEADGDHFADFVRDQGERAFRLAYRLCGNVEEAKDLVAESFCRALRGWDRSMWENPPEGWFVRILRNLYLDARKRVDHRRVGSLDAAEPGGESRAETLPAADEAVLDRLERQEAAEGVRAALASLSWEHRAVLALCDMEGVSYEDAASALGVPVGTVRSRVSRAREALRRAFAAGLGVRT